MKNLIHDLYMRIVERYFRVRTLGVQLVILGALILVAVVGVDLAGQVGYRSEGTEFNFQFGTGGAMPQLLVYLVSGFAALMIVTGVFFDRKDVRRERQKMLIVVEVRGLHTSPDTPAVDVVNPAFRGQRHSVIVDFRPRLAGELVNPQRMLSAIQGMMLNVESVAQGRDMSDVSVAVGGVAAVPAMFLIGMRLDDESKVELFDWNRDLRSWKMIDGIDDDNRPLPLQMPIIGGADSEVVLAVSASYLIDETAVSATFPGMPVVRLLAQKIEANSYWSEAVQKEFAAEFRKTVQTIMASSVKRIHLVLAAPVSLTVRLGATYDERLHPELIVYQYERTSTPPYPWGIEVPHHGSPEPVIRPAASTVP